MNYMFTSSKVRQYILLLIILPGLFLADMIHGLLLINDVNFTVSILSLTRGIVFFLALLITFKNWSFIPRTYQYVIFLIIIFSLPGFMISIFSTFDNDPIIKFFLYYEVKEYIKLLYAPFLVIMYCLLITKYHYSKHMILDFIEYTAYFSGLSLFLMQLVDFGRETYSNTADLFSSGEKGLFLSQNEISLSLGLALCIATYKNTLSPGIIRVSLLIVSMLALIGLGTRTSLLIAALIPILAISVFVYANLHGAVYKKHFFTKIILIPVIIIGALSYNYFYKNTSSNEYQLERIHTLISGNLPRKILIENAICQIEKRGAIKNILGEGAASFQHGVYLCAKSWKKDGLKLVEVDWMDLYGAYGIILVLLIYSILIIIIYLAYSQFRRSRKPDYGIFLIMLILFVGHSILAGHALTAPMPLSIISAIIALILTDKDKRWYQASV